MCHGALKVKVVTPTRGAWPLTHGTFHIVQAGGLRLRGEFRFIHYTHSDIPITKAPIDANMAIILNSNISCNVTPFILVKFEDIFKKFAASILGIERSLNQPE
jgi:hypothetical protein